MVLFRALAAVSFLVAFAALSLAHSEGVEFPATFARTAVEIGGADHADVGHVEKIHADVGRDDEDIADENRVKEGHDNEQSEGDDEDYDVDYEDENHDEDHDDEYHDGDHVEYQYEDHEGEDLDGDYDEGFDDGDLYEDYNGGLDYEDHDEDHDEDHHGDHDEDYDDDADWDYSEYDDEGRDEDYEEDYDDGHDEYYDAGHDEDDRGDDHDGDDHDKYDDEGHDEDYDEGHDEDDHDEDDYDEVDYDEDDHDDDHDGYHDDYYDEDHGEYFNAGHDDEDHDEEHNQDFYGGIDENHADENYEDPDYEGLFDLGDGNSTAILPIQTPVPRFGDPSTSTTIDDDTDDDVVVPEVTPMVLDGEASPTDEEAAPTDEEEDKEDACFPSNAIVELKDGSKKRMDELSIGDAVRTGSSTFSKVFMFTHKDSSVSSNFITLTTASGASVTVTKNHYLYADGSLVASQEIALSSKLMLASGKEDVVTAISSTEGVGLYNPQTVDGNIVVGGILASTYTASVDPSLAHGLLVPFRIAYNILGLYTSAFDGGSQLLADLAPNGAVVVA